MVGFNLCDPGVCSTIRGPGRVSNFFLMTKFNMELGSNLVSVQTNTARTNGSPNRRGFITLSGAVGVLHRFFRDAGLRVQTVVRTRPRLARALGLGSKVGVCAVSVAALLTAVLTFRRARGALEDVPARLAGMCGEVANGIQPPCRQARGYDNRLVSHLRKYAMFQVRTQELRATLLYRARIWQQRSKVGDQCFAHMLAGSIDMAMRETPGERQAVTAFSSERYRSYNDFLRGVTTWRTVVAGYHSLVDLLLGVNVLPN